MKIVIKYIFEESDAFFISRKDNDDFEWMIYCLSMTDLFDEEGEPISDETKEMVKAIQPETWNHNLFIELFNKIAPYGYKATLD